MSSTQQINAASSKSKSNVPMSIYVPHVDASYTFDQIAHQFENVFELGVIERIEAVPKVNQKDGHQFPPGIQSEPIQKVNGAHKGCRYKEWKRIHRTQMKTVEDRRKKDPDRENLVELNCHMK